MAITCLCIRDGIRIYFSLLCSLHLRMLLPMESAISLGFHFLSIFEWIFQCVGSLLNLFEYHIFKINAISNRKFFVDHGSLVGVCINVNKTSFLLNFQGFWITGYRNEPSFLGNCWLRLLGRCGLIFRGICLSAFDRTHFDIFLRLLHLLLRWLNIWGWGITRLYWALCLLVLWLNGCLVRLIISL